MRRLVVVTTLALAVAGNAEAQPRADGTQRGAHVSAVPVPLDGIAAVVDDTFVFRSDVVARARPFLARLSKDPTERRVQLAALHKDVLSRLIDEILVAKDAADARIEVSDAEVSKAITQVAAANKLDRKQLEAEVAKQGMSVSDYETEIRRQILEAKWLQLRAVGKIDRAVVSDPERMQRELANQREIVIAQLRSRAFIEIR